ncbi:MAG: hypothetical protein FJ404_10830 [Verrucomicrobia bacterium]|nr:hypothetical protein [Verrucomicrobiota bacterium]
MKAGIWLAALGLSGGLLASLQAEFPAAGSKKGLQVQMVEDALALGIKHAAINVDLNALALPSARSGEPEAIVWRQSGREFQFHRGRVEALDAQIKPLSERGVLVYLILLSYASGDAVRDGFMLHPRYDPAAPNRLGAFNTATEEGRAWFRASIGFLSQRWSGADRTYGRAVGYILGNEVNSHWWWSNMGRVTLHEFVREHVRALRLAHGAIREHSSWARLYVSLEHHWSIRYPPADERQAFPGKDFLELLADQIRSGGDLDWHLAYHPYPENLFEPRFWNDRSAVEAENTPRITFKNLEVLSKFLDQPRFHYRGKPRRIILSEQGFHTPKGTDGEKIQAAAFCYAYRKVEALEAIDAFILHRHVDHAHEGGLDLGLWTRRTDSVSEPGRKKPIYECFLKADSPEWRQAFEFALPWVGLKTWPGVPDRN